MIVNLVNLANQVNPVNLVNLFPKEFKTNQAYREPIHKAGNMLPQHITISQLKKWEPSQPSQPN